MTPNIRKPRPIIAPRLHHATFLTLKLDEMVAWYETGRRAHARALQRAGAAWLTNDEANHRIALIAHPAITKPVEQADQRGAAPHGVRVR